MFLFCFFYIIVDGNAPFLADTTVAENTTSRWGLASFSQNPLLPQYLHICYPRQISTVHLFFISSLNQNKTSLRHAAVNAALLDIVRTVPDSRKTEKKKSTFWRVHRAEDKTISYRRVIRESGASCGPWEGAAGELRDGLKFPAVLAAFMFCLQTLPTLHHTVDISCAYGPVKTCFDCPCHKPL